MNWQCRLYGHQWRHPWNHEVVLTQENGPVYPFRCGHCESVKFLNRNGNSWEPAERELPLHDEIEFYRR
ncbi:hypothetical protein [Natronococcus wangiae]|uniref:hypothetical protein n=1 Tax=Natronococcus wangiae TaxID=3068275 RepID=UPI00273E01DD|nr:hypothetical protein [Natronococcus sp. AD5]